MAELDGSEWVNAQPLGKGINTPADEMYPYVHADGTLYFASNGHPGYGGLDLYKAVRDTTNKDSVVWVLYNMGAPFNGVGDDFGITFAGNTQDGFFSSNRGDKKGYDKIYRFTLPEMEFIVEGLITDEGGNPLSDAHLRLVGSDGTNSKLNARRDGSYKIKLKKDVKYVMLATCRGHLNAKEQWTTLNLKDSKTYTVNFALNPISRPVKMENVFYEFGKWEVTKASETELLHLVKLLQDKLRFPDQTRNRERASDAGGLRQDETGCLRQDAQQTISVHPCGPGTGRSVHSLFAGRQAGDMQPD